MRRATILSSLILASWVLSAQAETVVRYGISLADIPLTTGQPDRGAGAYQFTGHTIYDSLVAWEMDICDGMESRRGRSKAMDLCASARRQIP